jgi:hypothetical protein
MFLYNEAHKLSNTLASWQFSPTVIMPIPLLALVWFAGVWDPETITSTLAMVVALSPLWLPIFIGTSLYLTWIHFIRYQFWFRRETGLLEIQLPQEITKSPEAVEVFLNSIYSTGGETTFVHRIWNGSFKVTWSLEIASNEGRIGYYLHGPKVWFPAVEARIYGQFPEASVREVDDYVKNVPFNLNDYGIWAGEYMKSKPLSPLPFRTYVDFQMDKNTDDPDSKVDPMTNIFEIMNNMGPDQYFWMQLILKAHNAFEWYGFPEKGSRYVEEGKKQIEEIMKEAAARTKKVGGAAAEEQSRPSIIALTEAEREQIKRIEESLGKNQFEVGVRLMYIAKKERFHGINGAYLFRIFQVFKSYGNAFGGKPGRGMIQFDYAWEDFMGIRQNYIKRMQFFFYKYRAYFYVPYDQVPSVMTTEEIATLWHFPYSSVKTPGLVRVPARTSQGPTNLPTLPQ